MAAAERTVGPTRYLTVMMVGALAALALYSHVRSVSPVYSAELTVTLSADDVAADLSSTQPGLILVAQLVSYSMSERPESRRPSDAVSLAGEGVRRGYSVSVPSSGNQWVRRYTRPELKVQAVGTSPAAVRGELERALARIDQTLEALQAPLDLPDEQTLEASVIDPDPEITAAGGDRARALAAATLLAICLVVAALLELRRHPPRRSPRGVRAVRITRSADREVVSRESVRGLRASAER